MIKKIGCVQHDCAECVAREQDLVEKLKSAALQSYAIGYKDAQSGDKMQLAQPERTGWPAGLLQDDDRKLSKWLASKPDAKHVVDMAQPEQGASLKMQDIVCPNCGDMARTWPKQERPWVSLTREEINSALSKYASWYDFAAHLENILKEKNQ